MVCDCGEECYPQRAFERETGSSRYFPCDPGCEDPGCIDFTIPENDRQHKGL